MATDRVLALQARLDDAQDMLKVELKKEAPRDNVLAVIKEQVQELNAELKMLSRHYQACFLQLHVSM
jgi:ABC-type metal ion transport system substrate-binding protein